MAITAPEKLSDFPAGLLPAHIADPIFERAAQLSAFQQLIRRIPLGINGEAIPVVTGRMSAGWVAEGAKKPASKGTLDLKTMTPKKLAAIAVVSAEVVRANPGNYMTLIREQMAEAFAVAFDYAAAHNLGPDGTGTGPFATFLDQTTKSAELGANAAAAGGIHQDLVDAMKEIVSDTDAAGRRYRLTGWALDDLVEPRLLGAVDTTGRPLYIDLPTDATAVGLARPGRLLNRPSFMGEGVANVSGTILGYGGDWSQAAWGAVGGISYRVSTEATVTIDGALTSLWENNLVAVLAEAEYGFLLNDKDAIIQLRNDAGS
jgi:HK97 family phage major capsid protein